MPAPNAKTLFNFGVSLVFAGATGLGAKLPLFGWLALTHSSQ